MRLCVWCVLEGSTCSWVYIKKQLVRISEGNPSALLEAGRLVQTETKGKSSLFIESLFTWF